MKRGLLILITILGLSSVQAQESYVGVGATLADFWFPMPSVQVGGPVAQMEVRGTLSSILSFNDFGLDILYRFPISDAPLAGYVGGGPNAGLVFFGGGDLILGLRATAGLEYFTGNIGIYGELQPVIPISGFNGVPVFGSLRTGVNFYF